MVAMRVVYPNTTSNSSADGQAPKTSSNNLHGPVVEEIQGLIKVFKDGHIERPQIVPLVSPSTSTLPVCSKDVMIDRLTNVWARLYVPNNHHQHQHQHQIIKLLPLLVYFHGGGFCVGSAAWSCYHEFLSNLAAKASCLILSVNYRLAPENPLPAAYDDGVRALTWVSQEAAAAAGSSSSSLCGHRIQDPPLSNWARKYCDFSNIFLGGDSAGANIAYNVGLRIRSSSCSLLTNFKTTIKGTILIQPFFGGEARTASEKSTCSRSSALTLAVSDTYWRLSLPDGATRDHPWSNPPTKLLLLDNNKNNNNSSNSNSNAIMVCIAELDILKDRNLEFCHALEMAGKRVERQLYNGVGHAFHVLDKTHISTTRTTQLTSHINSFIASHRTPPLARSSSSTSASSSSFIHINSLHI